MKKSIVYLLTAVLFGSIFSACRQEEVPKEEVVVWDQEKVENALAGKWRVERVDLVTGTDTIDLEETGFDNPFFGIRKSILFAFQSGNIVFWSAEPNTTPNPKFRDGAQTYSFTDRSIKPMGITYAWDEELKTIVAVATNSNYIPVPQGLTAVLDVNSIVLYDSYQENEEADEPSNLTFRVEDGGSVYLFHLRPVWYYETDLVMNHFYYYVVFP